MFGWYYAHNRITCRLLAAFAKLERFCSIHVTFQRPFLLLLLFYIPNSNIKLSATYSFKLGTYSTTQSLVNCQKVKPINFGPVISSHFFNHNEFYKAKKHRKYLQSDQALQGYFATKTICG